VRDLDQDQRHDREEEELPAHRRTVSGTHRKRNRPTGLVVRPNLLDGAAEEHRPPARSELRECADEREEDDGEKSEAENEFAGHCPTGRGQGTVSSELSGFAAPRRGKNEVTERREARMYVGLGTILLIVLIIILLIWIF
jgi:hypothetical protein